MITPVLVHSLRSSVFPAPRLLLRVSLFVLLNKSDQKLTDQTQTVQVAAALPWGSSHHHHTRNFVHLVTHHLLEAFPMQGTIWQTAVPDATADVLTPLAIFTDEHPAAVKTRRVVSVIIEENPWTLATPRRILVSVR